MENLKVKRNIQVFTGEKYSVWKFRVRALLTELDVIKVIDDAIPAELTSEWQKAERIAKNIIVEYLADSFLSFASSDRTARDILNSLDVIYERKSLATQLALRKKLLCLKLQGDTPLMNHFTFFEDLISELIAAGAKLEETDKVSHLLLTLPSSYDGVITAIETLTEDNLTLAFVKTRLLDHEIKLKTENQDVSAKVLHVQCKQNENTSGISKSINYIPKKTKFSRYNYKSNKMPQKFFSKCHHCGRPGHMKKNCYYYKQELQRRNAGRKRIVQTVQTQPSTSNNDSNFVFMVGDHHYTVSENTIIFLMDSGASDHIVNRADLFSSYIDLEKPLQISIAKNGAHISATKKGTINVLSNLGIPGILEDVLYCPEIPHNLLSVRKMQQAGLTIIFNEKGVEVFKGGKAILTGKPLNNLISVKFIKNVQNSIVQVNATVSNNYDLWHKRLGHIGKSKFLELKKKIKWFKILSKSIWLDPLMNYVKHV